MALGVVNSRLHPQGCRLDDVRAAYSKLHSPFLSLDDTIRFISLESYNNGVEFEWPTTGKTYLGPFQFAKVTWNSVNKAYGLKKSFSLVNNLFAAMEHADLYARLNAKHFKIFAKQAGRPKLAAMPFNGVLAYLCHQQGAKGAVRTLIEGRVAGKQSDKTLRAFAMLRQSAAKAGYV